ncbi:porin [Singulisphaera sp. Ch08]|uniref:Porin n=1 Tax=Singulisphaera sp. Ch08 TaxID=3120278 RepID=A0AAU7C7A6_9BACT
MGDGKCSKLLSAFALIVLGGHLGWPWVAIAQDQPHLSSPSPTPPADASVSERLHKMEEMNLLLLQKFDDLARQNQALAQKNTELEGRVNLLTQGGNAPVSHDTSVPSPLAEDKAGGLPPATAGGGSKTGGGDPTTTGRSQQTGNRHRGKLPLKSSYDFDNDGFVWSTHDDELTLGVRAMSQVESRIYQQPNQFPVSNGFYNPRTRVYFEGQLSKPIQYEFSFQNTFDNLALLDAYLNFNYDPRFQLRVGRYKTPFAYEWYRVHVWHLLSPERSLFANNYEGNRRFGLMGWGTLLDQRIEYAVGTFNTQRNSYQPFDSRQDVMAFLNFKPFYNREEGFLLRDLHVGGSVNAGQENQPTIPAVLRTNSAPSAQGIDGSAAANSATLPFLAFNPGVLERGSRALWELHTAYYYGGLSLLAAWQGGHESYAKGANAPSHRIPIGGMFAQAGYIFTGETIRDRTLIDPIRPFDLRHGRFGLGAFEVTARYSLLDLDRRVFAAGLADPNLWTNRAEMTDVGFNWYLNKFVKIYFDWEHAMFGDPVVYNTKTRRKQLTSDLFWLRFQVYF